MCWNQGDWRFYKYYKEWQWKTYLIAKEICKDVQIDVLHQLNMIGFREPGYLWKLSKEYSLPLVWGPIDAKEGYPIAYSSGGSVWTKIFLCIKNFITMAQLKWAPRVRQMVKYADVVVAASSNSVKSICDYQKVRSILINETGCVDTLIEIDVVDKNNKSGIDLLWVGKLDFRKQLGLALKVLGRLNALNVTLHIVGGGDATPYATIAKKLGVNDKCVWYGSIPHSEVQGLMRFCDLLIFTSVAEGTPHVVLESIANNLPVVCFDTCGQGDVVNKSVGRKIPLSTPKRSIEDFAREIEYFYGNRSELQRLSENCNIRKRELSWDNKIRQMVNLYEDVLKKKNHEPLHSYTV
jgi:glycosyltransferase involved in cell wall biosynthesis